MGIVERCVLIGGMCLFLVLAGYAIGAGEEKARKSLSTSTCVILLLAIFGAAVLAQRAFDFGHALVVRPSPADAGLPREVGTSAPSNRPEAAQPPRSGASPPSRAVGLETSTAARS